MVYGDGICVYIVYVCVYVCVCVCMQVESYVYILVSSKFIFIHSYTHYSHTYIHLHAHIHTHTTFTYIRNTQEFSWLRLDGSVKHASREEIMKKFNEDNTIHILLCTTGVAGVGISLIGADRVVICMYVCMSERSGMEWSICICEKVVCYLF